MCRRKNTRRKYKYRLRQKGGSNQHAIIARTLFPGRYKQYEYGIRNKYGIAPRKFLYSQMKKYRHRRRKRQKGGSVAGAVKVTKIGIPLAMMALKMLRQKRQGGQKGGKKGGNVSNLKHFLNSTFLLHRNLLRPRI